MDLNLRCAMIWLCLRWFNALRLDRAARARQCREIAATAWRFGDALGKARDAAIDLAILDVNLDGVHTFPVARAIQRRGLPFVFATGYGEPSVPPELRAMPVLQKPFRTDELAQALRCALASP